MSQKGGAIAIWYPIIAKPAKAGGAKPRVRKDCLAAEDKKAYGLALGVGGFRGRFSCLRGLAQHRVRAKKAEAALLFAGRGKGRDSYGLGEDRGHKAFHGVFFTL